MTLSTNCKLFCYKDIYLKVEAAQSLGVHSKHTALSANEDSTADNNNQKGKKARKQAGDVFSILGTR